MLTKLDKEKNILNCLVEPSFLIEKPFEEITATEWATAIRGIAGNIGGLNLLLDKLVVDLKEDQD